MLETIGSLVNNLIVLVILASFLELALPGNTFQPYVKLAAGIMILISILNPLLQLFSLVPDLEGEILQRGAYSFEEVEFDREEGNRLYQESILREYEGRLEEQVKELCQKHEMELVSWQAEVVDDMEKNNFGEIKVLDITLTPLSPEKYSRKEPVVIEEVEIQMGRDKEREGRKEEKEGTWS
ncbi:MAG: hypothetical protein D5R97_03355, partial [Candidatus Syntrophonatronum acetioxidans]